MHFDLCNPQANPFLYYAADGDINDVLIKTLAEAHANTNTKLESVHDMFRKPQVNENLRYITYIRENYTFKSFPYFKVFKCLFDSLNDSIR